ncbi:arginine--tRNA ligase [Candidatus Saccharibacteria bacterium]|nr:arginine--tRNA ligase [Candidatus Saccharibacteria bacterium]
MNKTVSGVIKELYDMDVDVSLTRPEPKFGDYSSNVALQLAGQLNRNPREVAQEIARALTANGSFTSVEVAGPGFINVRLSDELLRTLADAAQPRTNEGVKYVIEYSCPNAFKELHTGHLYQTIFGDILARLIERSGATVQRTSFGGDVGLHVAKCLWGMVAELGDIDISKLDSIEATPFARARWISAMYVKGAAAYEAEESAKSEIDQLNVTIYGFHATNDHESALAKLYWTTRQWSFDYFDAFYDLINVDHMRYYPESATAPTGMGVVKEQLAKGNLKESDGAVVFEGDESKHLHTRVFVTSKGLPTYETKDIGVIWQEKTDYDFDKRILMTGNDQTEYMRVVFAAAETFRPELIGTMTHLTNGTVRFGDGSKMSSRLGNVSRAADVINIVREKVRVLVKEESQVESVTLGAIKYVFAKYRIGGDIAFDIDETVSLNGNSGPYLQYAHARARSIIRKATANAAYDQPLDETERALLRKLGEYSETLERATSELMTHHICNYLYELAQEFNRFYEKARTIGDDREAIRLGLVERYAGTLADGLSLLGIEAPEQL